MILGKIGGKETKFRLVESGSENEVDFADYSNFAEKADT